MNLRLIDLETQMVELAAVDPAAALAIQSGEYAEIRSDLARELGDFEQRMNAVLTSDAERIIEEGKRANTVGLAAAIAGVVLSLAMAIIISRTIAEPVVQAAAIAETIAGRFDCDDDEKGTAGTMRLGGPRTFGNMAASVISY